MRNLRKYLIGGAIGTLVSGLAVYQVERQKITDLQRTVEDFQYLAAEGRPINSEVCVDRPDGTIIYKIVPHNSIKQ